MYDIKWIREQPDAFDRGLKRRGLAPLSDKLIKLDETRRTLITKVEQAQARRNAASKDIGQAKAKKDEATAAKLMAEVAALKTSIPAMEAEEKNAVAALDIELAQIPNTPLDDVPDGADASKNAERHAHGSKRDYGFKPKQHFELGEALGQMDFELAAKLSGARFVVLQRGLARLERALGQLFLDTHTQEHGYIEVSPPLMVRDPVLFGTAQLPKFEEDQFFVERVQQIDALEIADDLKDQNDEELRAAALATDRPDVIRAWDAFALASARQADDLALRFLFVDFARKLTSFRRG